LSIISTALKKILWFCKIEKKSISFSGHFYHSKKQKFYCKVEKIICLFIFILLLRKRLLQTKNYNFIIHLIHWKTTKAEKKIRKIEEINSLAELHSLSKQIKHFWGITFPAARRHVWAVLPSYSTQPRLICDCVPTVKEIWWTPQRQ
jgi:hypothetical protein